MAKAMNLDELKLGLAGGIILGVCIFLITVAGIFGAFTEYILLISSMYGFLGYSITWLGAVLGGIYGFLDGFIFFWILAFLYNRLL